MIGYKSDLHIQNLTTSHHTKSSTDTMIELVTTEHTIENG